MDILFKNSYVKSKDDIKDFYRFYCFKRKWIIAFDIMIGISFCANVLSALLGYSYNISVFVGTALFVALQFFSYFYLVKKIETRDRNLYQGEIKVELAATNDYIRMLSSAGLDRQLGYDAITGVIQTKKLIFICSNDKLAYFIRKDSFEIGSEEDFLLFLKSKGVQVKIKQVKKHK